MSRDDAQSFLERVANDAEFREVVSKAGEGKDPERLVAVGAAHGLTFTVHELMSALRGGLSPTETGELSDAELEGVAGGLLDLFCSILDALSRGSKGGGAAQKKLDSVTETFVRNFAG